MGRPKKENKRIRLHVSLDSSIFDKFEQKCLEKCLDKSLLIEHFVREWLKHENSLKNLKK